MTTTALCHVQGAKEKIEELRGHVYVLIQDLSPVCGLAAEYRTACSLDDALKELWHAVDDKARQRRSRREA